MGVASRVFAIDWSGARKGAAAKIWLCEAADGEVLRLENGRSRKEVGDLLVAERENDPDFVVGFDFAFSFPAAFLAKRGRREVGPVWKEVAARGESWIAECPFPFWGKPGSTKPAVGDAVFRATELAVARESGSRPKSVFQIGGAGAVGVASLRGMPTLLRLRQAGFSIWPFDAPALPRVVEIWPRLFMGSLVKSRKADRTRFLAEQLPSVSGAARRSAVESDDALDAVVTGMAMDRHRRALSSLGRAGDRATRLEGEIWRPGL